MRIGKYIRQLKELTVSPHYQSKGEFNPFYAINIDVEKDIRPFVGDGSIKFKSVEQGSGELLKNYGGKYPFQINVNDSDTDKYIFATKTLVTGHLGQKTRKDSTASSNINEFLSLYFLVHKDYINPVDFQSEIAKKAGSTGVLDGEGNPVTYERLIELLDKDESADRDIQIGYNNAIAVAKDLSKPFDKLYWVPRGKPEGVATNNPSDIIIKLSDGNFVGYSNKISSGKDATPKFNTSITAFYSKLDSSLQIRSIQNLIDKAWNDVKLDKKYIQSNKSLSIFSISNEKFSETSSKAGFAKIAKVFQREKLKFYAEDFYYPFRNNLINTLGQYLKNPTNMAYFLNTVGYYTFPDPTATPCPYKLLIGNEKGVSTIKDVSSNEDQRQIFFTKGSIELGNCTYKYDNKGQSMVVGFNYKPLNKKVTFPITMRTRASGGWSGKSLYITTSGFKIT